MAASNRLYQDDFTRRFEMMAVAVRCFNINLNNRFKINPLPQ